MAVVSEHCSANLLATRSRLLISERSASEHSMPCKAWMLSSVLQGIGKTSKD